MTSNDDGQLGLEFESDGRDLTTAERFAIFHAANPNVYDTLARLARQWVRRTGRHKVGVAALYEVARWELALRTNDPDYKINNDFRAYYARLLMRREPDLEGLFELRRSEADTWLGGAA